MRTLARWCIAHRRTVVVGWVVVLIVANVAGAAAGSDYNSNFKGQSSAGSQRALDLLGKYFPQRKGDSAAVVFESTPPITSPAVRADIDRLLERIGGEAHVSGVVSPYAATQQISPDGHIAYATVLFNERSFQLPAGSINRVIHTAEGARTSTLQIQLGGSPIEQVQPPSTGPATGIGVLAAIVILLLTFGTVVAAGLPLLAALLALGTSLGLIELLVGVAFLKGPAIGSSLTVLLTMLAALTLLPAVLSKLGSGIDRLDPFKLRHRQKTRVGFWERWAEFVQRRPWLCGLAALAVLLVLASPILSLRLGATDAGTDATSTTTYQAYQLQSKGFGPGSTGPLQTVSKLPHAGDTAVAAELRHAFVGLPDVAAVSPAVLSQNGDVAVINVIPKTTPRAKATSTLLSLLRDKVIPPLERRTGAVVYVGGTTALFADFSSFMASKLPLFIGAVVLISALLLLVVFRSVFVAAKAIVMNLLSVGAAFGVVVAVFQWGWLGSVVGISTTSPIAAFLPVMVFAIVFGLSMDYEVFLMSRMHEEWERTGDAAYAMRHGLASTGRVITAAAAIMVCVFASFVLGDNLTIKLFGVGLAAAVFLDAFLIRAILVPAIMALMGPRAWWLPRGLDRALPRLNVDPGGREVAAEGI